MQASAQIGVTGLAVMGRNLARNLARHGHDLVLTGIQPLVRRLLNLTGLNTYLHLSALETPLVTQVEACRRHHDHTEESGPFQVQG